MGRFGIDINKSRNAKFDKSLPEFSTPSSDEGEIILDARAFSGGGYSMSSDIAIDPRVASESELINQYRQLSLHAEPDQAISEIVKDAIIIDQDTPGVEISLDAIDKSILPNSTKKEIAEEFKGVLELLKFKTKGSEIFHRWYVDSRLVYHKMVNPKQPKKGIQKLKFLDPRKIRKIKEVEKHTEEDMTVRFEAVDEYFLYFETPFTYDQKFGGNTNVTVNKFNMGEFAQNYTLKISKDSICYVTSGLIDPSTGVCFGHLQKAVRPFNQLKWAEDSMMVRRVANAGEKIAISVDCGKMNAKAADRYMQGIIADHQNQKTYNANTGEFNTDPRVMSVQETLWFPKFSDGRGTEITTIGSNPDFSDNGDIDYWRVKLYNSLRVPSSRFENDSASVILGTSNEISKEELKFAKFIRDLRQQFSELFSDILKTQLVLKGILTEDEWDEIEADIQYDFLEDSYYTEAKEQELLMARVATANALGDMVGKYFSNEYVQKQILRMSDEQIKEEDAKILEERKNPKYADEFGDDNDDSGGSDDGSDSGSGDKEEPEKIPNSFKLPKIGE